MIRIEEAIKVVDNHLTAINIKHACKLEGRNKLIKIPLLNGELGEDNGVGAVHLGMVFTRNNNSMKFVYLACVGFLGKEANWLSSGKTEYSYVRVNIEDVNLNYLDEDSLIGVIDSSLPKYFNVMYMRQVLLSDKRISKSTGFLYRLNNLG